MKIQDVRNKLSRLRDANVTMSGSSFLSEVEGFMDRLDEMIDAIDDLEMTDKQVEWNYHLKREIEEGRKAV